MNASANLLAISPEIRERRADWLVCQRYRIERGYEYAEAEVNARAAYQQTMARAAEIARDAAIARQMRDVP